MTYMLAFRLISLQTSQKLAVDSCIFRRRIGVNFQLELRSKTYLWQVLFFIVILTDIPTITRLAVVYLAKYIFRLHCVAFRKRIQIDCSSIDFAAVLICTEDTSLDTVSLISLYTFFCV